MVRDLLSSPAILLLAAVAVVLFVVWLRTRERRFAVLLGVVGALLVLFGLWKAFGPESDAKQIQRKLYALGAGVRSGQVDQVAEHVSDTFDYQGIDKPAMRGHIARFLASGELTDVKMWDDEAVEFLPAPVDGKRAARIAFKTKAVGRNDVPETVFFRCIAVFVLDGDNQWRLQGFELISQPGGQTIRIPQLPVR